MKHLTSSLLGIFVVSGAFALGVDMDAPKTIKADKIEYNIKSEEMTASGNTEITNAAGEKIKSDKIEYNVKSTEIKASGNTKITNAEGQIIKLDHAKMSKKDDFVSANDIELWLGKNVYIRAEEITKHLDETIAKHAIFTACDKCDSFGNAWEISGTKIIRDMQEKMLYFHNAVFWLYNDTLPIFWLPYYEMPDPTVKYKSGLLMPSINSTNAMGAQINIPVYINLSDTHDLTTTFSILTKENPLFQLEHRLNLNHSEFRTTGSFTRNKTGDNRWHVFNNDVIELGENARAFVYIQRTSDKTYLQKYGFYDTQPYLDSGAKIEIFGQTSYIVADSHIFQELRDGAAPSGNILPDIRGVYQTNPLFAETYLRIDGDILSVMGSDYSNQRFIGEGRIVSPWTLWGGNRLTLSAATRYDIYNFNKTTVYVENDTLQNDFYGIKSRFLPNGYIEWGLPLFDVQNDWTYVLEPRARLTIMNHTDTKSVFAPLNDSTGRFLSDTTLFSDNRYAGLDVWENSNFADYGVQWLAFNQNHNIEVFLGQTYDFKKHSNEISDFNDNGFRKDFSDYVGRVSYNNNKNLQLSSRFRFDRQDMSLQHIENSAYIGRRNTYLTLGHIWDAAPIDISSAGVKDTHELRAGAGLQITNRTNIKEYVIYNVYEHVWQSHTGGIYYNHPCYYLALEYKRDNAIRRDYVGGTTFQFRFGISIDGRHY